MLHTHRSNTVQNEHHFSLYIAEYPIHKKPLFWKLRMSNLAKVCEIISNTIHVEYD
jgi:hypothetical protein